MAEIEAHNARVAAGKKAVSCSRNGVRSDFKPENVSRQPETLKLTFKGQIVGGKNNLIVTRSGHRFPKKSWAQWRDRQVEDIKSQLPPNFEMITKPCQIEIQYVASDKRRRDMPAILDSIFHVMEKAGVIADDTLFWVTKSTRRYCKNNGFAVVEFIDL